MNTKGTALSFHRIALSVSRLTSGLVWFCMYTGIPVNPYRDLGNYLGYIGVTFFPALGATDTSTAARSMRPGWSMLLSLTKCS